MEQPVSVCPNEEIKKHVAAILHQATPEHAVEAIVPLLMPPKEKGLDFQVPVPALRGRLQLKGDPMELVVKKWLAVCSIVNVFITFQIETPNEWIEKLSVTEGKMAFLNVVVNKLAFTKFVLQTIHQAGKFYG
jgi:hypothetical protein